MDDFREWLSDNLRYFMLGFGILAVVLILFFGVRFISSKFGNQKTTEPKQETQQETETPTTTQDGQVMTPTNFWKMTANLSIKTCGKRLWAGFMRIFLMWILRFLPL